MGGEQWTIAVKATGSGAKYANAYESVWWMMTTSLEHLGVTPEAPVKDYLLDVVGKRAQERLRGKRPFGKRGFELDFPGHAGLSSVASHLGLHWARLGTALYFRHGDDFHIARYHLALVDPPELHAERAAGRFACIGGRNWSVGEEWLHAQGERDAIVRAVAELTSDDRAVADQVRREGRCACAVCAAITPTEEGGQRLVEAVERASTWPAMQSVGFWIASLLEPSPALIHSLVDRASRFYVKGLAYSGVYSPGRAFHTLARLVPATREVLIGRAGLDGPATALAMAALRAHIDGQALGAYSTIVLAALQSDVDAVIEALRVLQAATPDPSVATAILDAVERLGSREHPGLQVMFEGLDAWRHVLAGFPVPPPVEAFLRAHAATTPADHLTTKKATALLHSTGGL